MFGIEASSGQFVRFGNASEDVRLHPAEIVRHLPEFA